MSPSSAMATTDSSRSLGDMFGIPDHLLQESCSLSLKSPLPPPFLLTEPRHNPSRAVIFAFSPSFSSDDWVSPTTSTHADLSLFPSLRSIGLDQPSLLHPPFLRRFIHILSTSHLDSQVRKAVADGKRIIFTGHSSGGAIATLAAVWLLNQSTNLVPADTFCVTFGCPLVGDAVFGHALRRENWANRFLHFVSPRDVVPRVLLSPLDADFLSFLHLLDPASSKPLVSETRSQQALRLYTTAARNAACVAGQAAIAAAGSTNLLPEALLGFVRVSPYRPAGVYAFCTDAGGFVVVRNPDAVLQLLFYCLQAGPGEDVAQLAGRSFEEHFEYEMRLARGLAMRKVVSLEKKLDRVPLSSGDGAVDDATRMTHFALRALGVSTEGRLCLRAAGELEQQKVKNQMKIDANREKIEGALKFLGDYRTACELRGVGYYDTFKLQRNTEDFKANLTRLELAGLFDEIIEMLKRMELPDGFEGRMEWVELGTEYRRLVEPLDIANYYRHAKNEDTGPYLIRGRPRRYKVTQRWLERAHRMAAGTSSESCFWARVEELSIEKRPFEETREWVLELERDAVGWIDCGLLGRDVLLEGSTLVRWWKTLPSEHRSMVSSLRNGVCNLHNMI